jgi:hypothetical protein
MISNISFEIEDDLYYQVNLAKLAQLSLSLAQLCPSLSIFLLFLYSSGNILYFAPDHSAP